MANVLKNIFFCYGLMEERKKYMVQSLFHMLLGITIPFLIAMIPRMVVLLDIGYEHILLILILFVIITSIVQCIDCNCILKCQKELMLFRYSLGSRLLGSALKRNISALESPEGKRMAETARRAIYEGNYVGIEIYLQAVQESALNFMALIIEIIILIQCDWVLAVLAVLSSVVIIMYNNRQYGKIDEIQGKLSENFTPLRSLYEISLDSKYRNDIWLYGLKSLFSQKFIMYKKAVDVLERKYERIFVKADVIGIGCLFVRDILIYLILIFQMSKGAVGLDTFIFLALIIENCEKWMEDLVTHIQEITGNHYLVSALREFLTQEKSQASKDTVEPLSDRIEFKNVSFSYGEETKVINDVNLSIKCGEKIAITGLNGAGKSTLIKLLLGIYSPANGQILWDGKNIQDIDWKHYKDFFSVVSQNSELLPFALAENIAGNCDWETNEESLKKAIKEADLAETTEKLPCKERTVLTQYIDANGISLSGGEKQKVFIARALYKKHDILVFDEPTASLDPIAEEKLYLHLANIARDKTCIFISHRLISTRFCDRIVFLENGRILESGTHDELMESKGKYAELFELQGKRYQENEY